MRQRTCLPAGRDDVVEIRVQNVETHSDAFLLFLLTN